MPASSMLYSLYLSYLAKPREERAIYRLIARRKYSSLVEIGVGDGTRAQRMIALAGRNVAQSSSEDGPQVQYTGIDAFDMRTGDRPELKLRTLYQQLHPSDAAIRLLPGDAETVLPNYANSLLKTDLLILAGEDECASLSRAWSYIPRMLHANSTVLRAKRDGEEVSYERVKPLEVERLASEHGTTRRAA